MSKIPWDILRDADNIAASLARIGVEEDSISGPIAKAINKERQRCANIAREQGVVGKWIADRIDDAVAFPTQIS